MKSIEEEEEEDTDDDDNDLLLPFTLLPLLSWLNLDDDKMNEGGDDDVEDVEDGDVIVAVVDAVVVAVVIVALVFGVLLDVVVVVDRSHAFIIRSVLAVSKLMLFRSSSSCRERFAAARDIIGHLLTSCCFFKSAFDVRNEIIDIIIMLWLLLLLLSVPPLILCPR